MKSESKMMVGRTMESTVTVDGALAELLGVGHRKNNDVQAVWAACHVLAHLGLVTVSQGSIKKNGGRVTLHTFFDANEKLRQLMHECGQQDEGDIETK